MNGRRASLLSTIELRKSLTIQTLKSENTNLQARILELEHQKYNLTESNRKWEIESKRTDGEIQSLLSTMDDLNERLAISPNNNVSEAVGSAMDLENEKEQSAPENKELEKILLEEKNEEIKRLQDALKARDEEIERIKAQYEYFILEGLREQEVSKAASTNFSPRLRLGS